MAVGRRCNCRSPTRTAPLAALPQLSYIPTAIVTIPAVWWVPLIPRQGPWTLPTCSQPFAHNSYAA